VSHWTVFAAFPDLLLRWRLPLENVVADQRGMPIVSVGGNLG
jgi:hypothetical protein